MRYIFNINRNKIYVYKGVFLLLWLRLVIHGDNIMMMISQCSEVTLTLIFQYFFAMLCVQQSFITTKFINATKECWIHTFDLKKRAWCYIFLKVHFKGRVIQYLHIFNYTSIHILFPHNLFHYKCWNIHINTVPST